MSKRSTAMLRAASLTLLLGCAAIASEAGAADPARQWFAQGDEVLSSLTYGTPESDDVMLNLTCDHATKAVTIWYRVEPARTKDPATLPMTIRSEGGSVGLIGKGSRSELDDAYALEATTELTPELDTLLGQARTLTLVVEDQTADLPVDATARQGIGMIEKGCRK